MPKLLIGIIGLAVVGGGAYVLTKEKAEAPSTTTEQSAETTTEADDNFAGEGSLASLFARGQSARCTFIAPDEVGATDGTVWYADGNFRISGSYESNGTRYESNMIGTPDYNYIWGESEAGPMALRLANQDAETERTFDPSQPQQGIDMETGVRYECVPWRVDPSQFVPPADIEFMDLGAMFESMMEESGVTLPEGVTMPAGF